MSIVIKINGKEVLFCKGASEIVLGCCTKWMTCKDGTVEKLDEAIGEKIKKAIESMGNKSLRTLCFAYKECEQNDNMETSDGKGVY
jgi:magnesium-transporting ATPase (P-type)